MAAAAVAGTARCRRAELRQLAGIVIVVVAAASGTAAAGSCTCLML